MKHLNITLAGALLLVLGTGVFVADGLAAPKKLRRQAKVPSTVIPVTLYGMHVNPDTGALPPTGWFGQQRLWDSQTNWYQLEPNQSVTITAVERTNNTSKVYVTPPPTNWAVQKTVFVDVGKGVGTLSSFNGLYTITAVDTGAGTVSYTQQLGNVVKTSASGTSNNFDFSELDKRLAYAAAPNLEVMYTFGKIPSFYSSDPNQACGGTNAPDGSCFRPNDMNSDGTGVNQHWRLFVAGLAEHIAGLNSSTYAKPGYFETWNEFDGDTFWHYNNTTDNDDPQALVRLLDDAACIIKGTGNITALGHSCAADTNFVAKGVLSSAKMLSPCVSSTTRVTAWSNFYNSYPNSGATANADIIGIHGYGYVDSIQSITSIQRVNSTVTVTVDASQYNKNMVVKVSGVQDSSFNGTFTITSRTSTQIVYSQSGPDASSSGGQVQNGPDQLQAALSAFISGLSTADQDKPFWVTESYWGGPGPADLTTQEGYIVRFFTILWSTGVARANWYTWNSAANLWDSSPNSGDVPCDGVGNDPLCNLPLPRGYVDPVGQANRVGQGWLLGTTMSSPCSSTGSIWTCGLQSGSRNELMVWDSAKDRSSNTSSYTPPGGYIAYINLSGVKTYCTPGACTNIPIGAKPILFVQN